MTDKLTIIAELRECKATKTQSNDMVYTLKVVTDDPSLMALSQLEGDKLLKLVIEEAQ